MATITNSSLGELDRLPGEIRNTIYKLVINSDCSKSIRLLGRCAEHTSLAFVSKQIFQEVAPIIREFSKSSNCIRSLSSPTIVSCQHDSFTLTVRKHGLKEKFDEWCQQSNDNRHHLDKPSFTIKFITGHLSKHAPASITVPVNIVKPEQRTYILLGGVKKILSSEPIVISFEGGHTYLNRTLEFEVWRRVKQMRHDMDRKKHRAQSIAESELLEIAEVISDTCRDAKRIVAEGREKVRRVMVLRDAKKVKKKEGAAATRGGRT